MNQMPLSNGLLAEYPGRLTVRDRLAVGGLGALGAPSPPGDPVLDAFTTLPGLTLVGDIEISGEPDAAGLGALATPAGAADLRIRVPLEPGEGAVVLSDCDGLLRWELPVSVAPPPDGGLGALAAPARQAVFSAPFRPVPANPAAAGLGFNARVLLAPLRKLVFRFLARAAAEGVSTFLERGIENRPMVLRQDGGRWAWRPLDSFAELPVASGPRRLLLCVHGTFSSSEGSFDGLWQGDTPARFLDRAAGQYDAIIGFDHRTLRDTVPDNAAALKAALAALPGDALHLDAIAFSRGGLVLRWLAEVEQAFSGRLTLDRAVFVGCTNAGTLLADPAHWRALVDLYTNLVAAAARFAALIGGPGVAAPAGTIAAALRGLLSFVQLLASEAIDGDAVPGLASMAPDGDVVGVLNQPRAAPLPSPAWHYVCDADFAHRLFDGQGLTARGLPARLFLDLADTLVDDLFAGEPNDLVVHQASMGHLAPWLPPERIAGRRRFAATDGVYHTIYFNDPRLADQLAVWLCPAGGR